MSNTRLNLTELERIADTIVYRQNTFADETLKDSVLVALCNAGSGHVAVSCVGGEWSGTKGDLIPNGRVPKCPNGHVLVETSVSRVLAWAEDEELAALMAQVPS